MFQCTLLYIQTSLGTNGPTGADVPLNCKQTNKQKGIFDIATHLGNLTVISVLFFTSYRL
jgi:hypothetical protein